ncbi:MAG: glycosyltransferase family 4 protein [Candidatus Omnitrophota bacterium]
MKRVLIVNKYHFVSGGAERYFLSVMEAMKKRGIEPIPFSIRYPQTLPSPYERYFIEPVVRGSAAKIQNQRPSWRERWTLFREAVYNGRAARAVSRIIDEQAPEIAYFLNFNTHISPSAIEACVQKGVPVVMRMSDFNLVCSSNMYYRDGHPCMDCKKGLHHAVIHRCVHGSFMRSLANVMALTFHRRWKIYDRVSAFICPSLFMKGELEELGIPASKVHHLNTFAGIQEKGTPDLKEPYFLFIGRLAPYKGVDIAVRAFAKLRGEHPQVRFYVVGDEGDADAERVRTVIRDCGADNVHLLPFERNKQQVLSWIRKSLAMVVPSEFYENLPNTILESFSCGRPVIATRLGCLPDIVKEGEYGLLYEFGSSEDLAGKIDLFIRRPEERERMGMRAYEAIQRDYGEKDHMDRLLEIFGSVARGEGVS